MKNKTNTEEIETPEQKYRYAQQDLVDASKELEEALLDPNKDEAAIQKYQACKVKLAAAQFLAEGAPNDGEDETAKVLAVMDAEWIQQCKERGVDPDDWDEQTPVPEG